MLNYQYCCVSPKSLKELNYIIDNARDITYSTFIRHVNKEDLKDLALGMGYDKDLKLKDDWHVSFHKSKTKQNGKTVYYFRQSSIEYIFY